MASYVTYPELVVEVREGKQKELDGLDNLGQAMVIMDDTEDPEKPFFPRRYTQGDFVFKKLLK